jgi:hypothetical protein
MPALVRERNLNRRVGCVFSSSSGGAGDLRAGLGGLNGFVAAAESLGLGGQVDCAGFGFVAVLSGDGRPHAFEAADLGYCLSRFSRSNGFDLRLPAVITPFRN